MRAEAYIERMERHKTHGAVFALILGACILAGLSALGLLINASVLIFKGYERTVIVRGLSEREYPADTVVWPLVYEMTADSLSALYEGMGKTSEKMTAFLRENGIRPEEVSLLPPAVTDKSALDYGSYNPETPRYKGAQIISVYSKDVARVAVAMENIGAFIAREGIILKTEAEDYRARAQYLFTRLNEVKPEMIEEATRGARAAAAKFAADSESSLGKIKRAVQGQFDISPRADNPRLQTVRVVTTVEYYLSD